jgi:hypothetical protein
VFDLIDTDGPPAVIPFAIKTTFDNLFHVSAQITFTITCSPSYVLTEVAPPTNPQYVAHLDGAVGYTLPSYIHDEVFGCPIDTYQVTNAGSGGVSQPSGVAGFGTADPAELVKPANNALHQSYVFYTKITSSDGGSTGYFGPYTLRIGCTTDIVSFTDSLTLIDTTNIPVGDSLLSAYQFYIPVLVPADRVWCLNTNNAPVNAAGSFTSWSGTTMFTPTVGQPAYWHDIYSTTYPEII